MKNPSVNSASRYTDVMMASTLHRMVVIRSCPIRFSYGVYAAGGIVGEEAVQFQLRHSERHMSFIVAAEKN